MAVLLQTAATKLVLSGRAAYALNPWIVKRGAIYHFRRVVPAKLRRHLGRSELVRSLGTPDRQVAKQAGLRLYLASERLFSTVQTSSMLTDTQLARLVQDFYDGVLEEENRIRLSGKPLPDQAIEARVRYLESVAAQARKSLAANRLDDARVVAEAILRKQKVDLDSLTSQDWNQARQAMLRAGVDVAEALRARYAGDFNFEPRDSLLKLKVATETNISPRSYQRDDSAQTAYGCQISQPLVVSEGAVSALSLAEIYPGFLNDQVVTGAWEKQSAAQAKATFRLFIDICGDKPLAAYTRRDAGLFKDTLFRLPGDYGKAATYRGLSVTQILTTYRSLPANSRSALLTAKTIKRHFSSVSSLWQAKLPQAEVSENIFSGFRFGSPSKAAVDQRDMWEKAELSKLFSTPVWTGSASKGRRNLPGSFLQRDEKFWLPLIAVFSGLRQEEICQLEVGDVCQVEDIWLFDINNRGGKMLKNSTAPRIVPVHSELLRLGLLARLPARTRQDTLLFSELTPGGADDRYGHSFSKWFTRYRRAVGIYRRGLDFHSFRHTATTLMHGGGIESAVIDHVTGHVTPGETARYTKRSTLAQLKAAIETIRIGVDLSSLYQA